VLAEDLSRVPVERLRDVAVAMTLVNGEIVCEARGWVLMSSSPDQRLASNRSATDGAASIKRAMLWGSVATDPQDHVAGISRSPSS
jgi:hypothetical protein